MVRWVPNWEKNKQVYRISSLNQIIEYGTWNVFHYKVENGKVFVNINSSIHLYERFKDEEWYGSLEDEEYYDIVARLPHGFPGL